MQAVTQPLPDPHLIDYQELLVYLKCNAAGEEYLFRDLLAYLRDYGFCSPVCFRDSTNHAVFNEVTAILGDLGHKGRWLFKFLDPTGVTEKYSYTW